jgi:hypothetical protein
MAPAQNQTSMYHVGGYTREGKDIAKAKEEFHNALRKHKVRQYSGGFGEDGKFSLQMLIDLPQDFINLIDELKHNDNLFVQGNTSIKGMKGHPEGDA